MRPPNRPLKLTGIRGESLCRAALCFARAAVVLRIEVHASLKGTQL